MTSRNTITFLQDIIEAIEDIEGFTEEVSFEEFVNNKEKIYAVQKAIELMGEAVKNIPDSVRNQYTHIPWRNIAGMRDKLSHQYWKVDLEVIWKVVEDNLPSLKVMITQVILDFSKNKEN
ncbi:MAG: DUF86 domain-containing protein [Symploca sp. SIO1B1]|nr:DUF86 domain-containing protein [Symploca sp. SIO1B1]